MKNHRPIIGNFFLNHPLLSGIKMIVVFVWIPAFAEMNWDAYLHFYLPFIVPLLYGIEIISFVLTLFGRGDLVDNTMGFSDAVWVYVPYAPYQNYIYNPPSPAPIIIYETIHHHH